MTHRVARLVAAILLLVLPMTAFALDDCKFSAERKGGIDTTSAERVTGNALIDQDSSGDVLMTDVKGTVRLP